MAYAYNGFVSTSDLKSDVTIVFFDHDFLKKTRKFRRFAYIKGRYRITYYLHGFSGHLGLKWRFWGQNRGRGGAIVTPNELVLTFGGSYVRANFGENRSRNATVRVPTDGHTH